MTAILKVRDLTISYGAETVVYPISFDLYAGQTLAIVGESGSGKTTTALAISGLLPPQAQIRGNVFLGQQDILELNAKELRTYQGKDIGIVFQEPLTSLNPVLNIKTQIDEILKTHTKLKKTARTARVIELLSQVELANAQDLMLKYPHQLSGGQRQRVMIAMAIACQPKILIADEPTTALDVTTQKDILNLLNKIQQQMDMAILLISHDLGVVNERADYIMLMHKGRVLEQGPTQSVFKQPKNHYTKLLVRASIPIELNLHYQQDDSATHQQAPILLKLENINKKYIQRNQTIQAVKNLNLNLYQGETLGLVGESGCGKSTLSRLIMRIIDVDNGHIYFHNQSIENLKAKDLRELRTKIQMIFQDPYGSLNPRVQIGTLFDRLQQLHFPRRTKEQRLKTTLDTLDAIRLEKKTLQRYPHEFSGGQRQRIAIARALILQPELIICDEPVSALDVSIQAQILDLFVELKNEFNLSYLFISHDLAVVRYISDRLSVMHQGQIVENNKYQNNQWDPPSHPYTNKLMAAVASFPHPLPQI